MKPIALFVLSAVALQACTFGNDAQSFGEPPTYPVYSGAGQVLQGAGIARTASQRSATIGNTRARADDRRGGLIFGYDGTTYRRIGSTTIGSDGSTFITSGNTTLGSDGTSYRRIGNTTVGSDGTFCRGSGTSIRC